MSRTYFDPAGLPDELLEALEFQTGLTRDRAVEVCRIYESLRTEGLALQDVRTRVLHVEDAGGQLLKDRADALAASTSDYLRAYSAAPVDEIAGYRKFDHDLRAWLSAHIGAFAHAILLALDLGPTGRCGIDPTRLASVTVETDVETGTGRTIYRLHVDDGMTAEQQRALRALWIVDAIQQVNYRGCTPDDRDRLQTVLQMEPEDLDDPTLAALEDMLIKSTPNFELFSTPQGAQRALHWGRDRAREACARLRAAGWPRLDENEITTLQDAEGVDNLPPSDVAVVLHIAARSAQRSAGLETS